MVIQKTVPQYDIQQQYFRKPEHLSKKEAIRRFLYNPKKNAFFGRSPSSWGKLILKFIILTLKRKVCEKKTFPGDLENNL